MRRVDVSDLEWIRKISGDERSGVGWRLVERVDESRWRRERWRYENKIEMSKVEMVKWRRANWSG
jgi:hypothetical protein